MTPGGSGVTRRTEKGQVLRACRAPVRYVVVQGATVPLECRRSPCFPAWHAIEIDSDPPKPSTQLESSTVLSVLRHLHQYDVNGNPSGVILSGTKHRIKKHCRPQCWCRVWSFNGKAARIQDRLGQIAGAMTMRKPLVSCKDAAWIWKPIQIGKLLGATTTKTAGKDDGVAILSSLRRFKPEDVVAPHFWIPASLLGVGVRRNDTHGSEKCDFCLMSGDAPPARAGATLAEQETERDRWWQIVEKTMTRIPRRCVLLSGLVAHSKMGKAVPWVGTKGDNARYQRNSDVWGDAGRRMLKKKKASA